MVARPWAQAWGGQTASGTFSQTGQYNPRGGALTSSSGGVGSWAEALPVEKASINPTVTNANRPAPLVPPSPPCPPLRLHEAKLRGWSGGAGGGDEVSEGVRGFRP